jgi:hypothetical protein
MFTAALFITAKRWGQLTCPSAGELIKNVVCPYSAISFSLKRNKVLQLGCTLKTLCYMK